MNFYILCLRSPDFSFLCIIPACCGKINLLPLNIFRREYKKIIKEISEYFKLMDSKFYNELEDKPNDMIELVDFLNELK